MEAVPEVQEGVDLIETYCAFMERSDGFRTPLGRLSEHEENVSVLLPYGVFAVIAPFNFPFALAIGMTSAALVTGNTVVLKPAEETPRITGVLGDLATEAGLPPGVLNVVHGDDAAGRALVAAAIDGVAFTGSAEAGHAIFAALNAKPPMRPVLAEMGGKNPAVVTASADVERAAAGIVKSAFGLSGQKCSSCSRVIVAREHHDELVRRIAEGAAKLKLGDPADSATNLGPVAGDDAIARFDAAVADARRDGEIVTGGERTDHFVAPTVVTGLPKGHRLTREELFLPFLTVTAGRLARRGARGGQRRRLRPHRRHLQRGRGRAHGVPGAHRGRRRVRQPPRGGDHRRLAGDPDVPGLEGERDVREGRTRPALRAAVHAGAGRTVMTDD